MPITSILCPPIRPLVFQWRSAIGFTDYNLFHTYFQQVRTAQFRRLISRLQLRHHARAPHERKAARRAAFARKGLPSRYAVFIGALSVPSPQSPELGGR